MEAGLLFSRELSKISAFPAYQRERAEYRFLLIKEYKRDFERKEKRILGQKFSILASIKSFCDQKNISSGAFSCWLGAYHKGGIKALLPKYGNRKGCSKYGAVLPLLAEAYEPGQPLSETYARVSTLCGRRQLAVPSRKTLERILEAAGLVASKEGKQPIATVRAEILIDIRNPLSSLNSLKEIIINCPLIPVPAKADSVKRLRQFQQTASRKSPLTLSRPLTGEEIIKLKKYKAGQHKGHHVKAAALLMINEQASLFDVVRVTGYHPHTILSWIRLFRIRGISFIETKVCFPERQFRIQERTNRIIDIIHTPPSAHGINRTAWNYSLVARVFCVKYGEMISTKTVERAVKDSGYTWRHARKVLTSPDPEYMTKITKVLETLRRMKLDEAFFFIDEAGPYSVKKYGGVALASKDETRTLPERQKSKGKVQFIAALEAMTNQVSWRFIENKGTDSIIMMIETLRLEYMNRSKLFLTWDAISSHSSSNLKARVDQLNTEAEQGNGPFVEIVPLPSRAQFLNIVEAVLSGMKKAVVKNSDYPSKASMQGAISKHFEERNRHFQENPKRAGNKIWDKEAFDLDKLAGGLFRRM